MPWYCRNGWPLFLPFVFIVIGHTFLLKYRIFICIIWKFLFFSVRVQKLDRNYLMSPLTSRWKKIMSLYWNCELWVTTCVSKVSVRNILLALMIKIKKKFLQKVSLISFMKKMYKSTTDEKICYIPIFFPPTQILFLVEYSRFSILTHMRI